MKKVLLVLTIIGFVQLDVQAQSKKSIYDKNYPVCMTNNGYSVCSRASAEVGRLEEINSPEVSLRMMDTSVYMGYSASPWVTRPQSRIRVTIDDPQAPYEGKESMTNDGVKKNIQRNINVSSGQEVPPNDGGLSTKEFDF